MKLRNLFAGIAASAVALTSLAAVASANEAFLMYTDDSWAWGVWSAAEFPAGTTDVTGDGTYTVFVDNTVETANYTDEETGELVPAVANGAMVFCVDIDGLAKDYGFETAGVDGMDTAADKRALCNEAGVTVSDVKVTTYNTDGTSTDIAVDQSKVLYGDIEGNGKLRIEIQNEYGDSLNDPCIDKSTISFDKKIAVTFTISGLGGAAAEETVEEAAPAAEEAAPAAEEAAPAAGDVQAATTSAKGSPDTGIEDVAVVAGVAALAAGAFIVAKKRK